MPAVYGWTRGPLWAAVETCPPYRLIGLYHSEAQATSRAFEFGAPAAAVHPVPNSQAAQELVCRLRTAREGR